MLVKRIAERNETMLSIPGQPGATCDGYTRRELLRVGGMGLM